jgi:serine protease Do
MKWWLRNKNQNKFRQDIKSNRHLWSLTTQTAIVAIGLSSVGWFFHGDISRLKTEILASTSPNPRSHTAEVNRIASEISVRILGSDSLGSGFILQRQDREYIVITNQHVLRAGELPYRVQTPDGKLYEARVLSNSDLTQYDLAVLQFSTQAVYQTATVGNSSQLKVGEAIFAAGFPHDDNLKAPMQYSDVFSLTGFALKQGRITIFLDKALEEGYQIGYTNDVKKGMSGGALLNSKGEVVGVNGKHAFPLWEAPDFYQDGSQPCAPLQDLITRSSLAIPIEKVIGLTPQLTTIEAPKSDSLPAEEDLTSVKIESEGLKNPNDIVSTMQAEAEATQNCFNTANKPKNSSK